MEDSKVDWMQELLVPIQIPTRDDKLSIQIFDRDAIADELICSLSLSIKSIMKYDKTNVDPSFQHMIKWINLYGAHTGYSGSNTSRMNKDPSEASTWKGRILVEYFTEDCKYPIYKIRDVSMQEHMDRIMMAMQPRTYQMLCEVGSGVALPSTEDYKLKVTIGVKSWDTGKPMKGGKNFCRWDKRFSEIWEDSY